MCHNWALIETVHISKVASGSGRFVHFFERNVTYEKKTGLVKITP